MGVPLKKWFRRCARPFRRLWFQCQIKIFGRAQFVDWTFEAVQATSGAFVTYHDRPVMAAAVGAERGGTRDLESLALVIQGPIVNDAGFTLETLKIYQRNFKGARIILSTWEDQAAVFVKQCEDMGITVLQNAKPEYRGMYNINLQIVSTLNGVRLAKACGAEHVLKMRTDQRIYGPNAADTLYAIIGTFPVSGRYPKQKKRIVGCSLNTFKYRLYGLSDMLLFGCSDDMLTYWDVALDERRFSDDDIRQAGTSLRAEAEWRVCEVYLATEFLKRVGRELQWSLEDSWNAFRDHFCIVDREHLDLYWPKYTSREYRSLSYGKNQSCQELSFGEWLHLYAQSESVRAPEYILDLPFR